MDLQLTPAAFFDLETFQHRTLLEEGVTYVWEPLARLEQYIQHQLSEHGPSVQGRVSPGAFLVNPAQILMAPGCVVESGAYVAGPCLIGPDCVIRHGAYLRGNFILGRGAVVGHASEVKNAILMDGAQAPHFAYVGDSILGSRANLGAGTKLSNLPISSVKDPLSGKRPTILIYVGTRYFDTGLVKMGAILGDGVQTGCNSVLNPGCLVGRNTLIYPNLALRKGYYPPGHIIKLQQTTRVMVRRR